MPFVIEYSGIPDVTPTEVFWLNCLFTVLESPSSATARKFRQKLYVDDVEKDIKSATWSVQDSQPAGTLEIELANIADRTAFTRTAEIRFVNQEYLAGVWTDVKTYCDGSILATSTYSLANDGTKPNDSFSVTVLPLLQQRLDKTPDQVVCLYDPAKTEVTDDQLEVVLDIDGEQEGTVTVTPIVGMHLGDVFEYVADAMGFAGYKTNINYEAWKLTRVDFPAGEPYWGAVAGIIGNHEPKLSVDADNYLVIRDGTLTDYISARTMTLDNFRSLNLNNRIERYKGCLVTRQLRLDEWDYSRLRQVNETQWFGGVAGQYPKTEVETWYQDFYRNSFPDTPVSSRIFSQAQREYATAFDLTSAVQETFSFIGTKMWKHEMREWGYAKAPQSWITFQSSLPSPHTTFGGVFESVETAFTSASDTVFSEALVVTKTARTYYSYFPLPGEADSVYVGQTDEETRALIMRDNDNPQLEDPFDQPLTKAQEAGNLVTGQGSYWGTTDRRRESQKTERKTRKVDFSTRGHSNLNSSTALIRTNHRDRRTGDIGDRSDVQPETELIKITEGADPTATLWRKVTVGEAPLIIFKPLCIRLNQKQDFPGGIDAQLPTYDATIEMGGIIDPQVNGRAASSLGIFEITGYTDKFENNSVSTEITAKQIA